ncbi:MAG TPA: hypothetical protein VHA79_09830 [Mycobacteriales bacterium]|nr:hypothetical protein [Mycobacteriales bacterium]
MRFLTCEELDRQTRRAYSSDRLPGLGLDRNALGETGAARVRDRRCRQCGEPILGRPGNATTCLVHRAYLGAPGRQELVNLIEEYEALVRALRSALLALDEGVDA